MCRQTRRSNKGAPGVDGRDFADIEAYGVGAVAWRTGAASEAGPNLLNISETLFALGWEAARDRPGPQLRRAGLGWENK